MSDAPAAKTLHDMRVAPRTPCFPSQTQASPSPSPSPPPPRPLSHPSLSDFSVALPLQSNLPLPPSQPSPPHSLPRQNHSSLRPHPIFKLFASAPLSSATAPHHQHEQMLANALSLSTRSPARHAFLRPDPASHLPSFPFAPCAQSPTHTSNFTSASLPTSIPHHRHQDVYDTDTLAFHFPDSPARSVAVLDVQHSALSTPAAAAAAVDHLQQVRSVMDPTASDIHLAASASAQQQTMRGIDAHFVNSAMPDARLPFVTPILPSAQLRQSSPQSATLSLSPDSHINNTASQTFRLHHSHQNARLKQQQQQQPQTIAQIQSQNNQHHHTTARGLHHRYVEHSSPMPQTRAFVTAGNALQQRVHPPSSHPIEENPAKRHKPNPESFRDHSTRRYQLNHHKRLLNLQENRCQLQDSQQLRHHDEELQQVNSQKHHDQINNVYKKTADLAQHHEQQQQDNQENQPRFNPNSHLEHQVEHLCNVPVPHIHDPKKLNQHYNYGFQQNQSVYFAGEKQGSTMDYVMERGVDVRTQMLSRDVTDSNKSVAVSPPLSVTSDEADEPGSPNMRQKIPCPHKCGKEYTRTHALKVHISTKHTGTNQEYKCKVCHKKFNRKDTLKRHFATTHELQRNWPCTECSKRFGQQAHLNTHVRTVHKKDRPHACDQCAKSFGTLYNLNAHKNTHSRTEKEYACETCRKTYKIKSSLARHQRKERHMESNSAVPDNTVECAEESPIRNPVDALQGMGNEDYNGGR